jgi:hypothetical protein
MQKIQRDQHPIDIWVRVLYKGEKARFMSASNVEAALVTLRMDMSALDIPHPRAENVNFGPPGLVQFYWRSYRNSVRFLPFSRVEAITDLNNQVLYQHFLNRKTWEDSKYLDRVSMYDASYLSYQHRAPLTSSQRSREL